jgi:hypothetical protein
MYSKGALSMLFLIIFSFPITGTYFLFKIRQFGIHGAINRLIQQESRDHKLILLKIPLSTEKNTDVFERTDEMEFKFEGKMYDVAKMERHGQFNWYWCVLDQDETALEESMETVNSTLLDPDSGQNKNDKALHVFLNTLFFQITIFDFTPSLAVRGMLAFFWKSTFLPLGTKPSTPPPQT